MAAARVLIVEDDAAMRALLAEGLGRKNIQVRASAESETALPTLAAEEFDVVLTDLNMPGLDGLELCARVAATRPDIPVVLLTAFGSLETAIGAMRAGAYDFVQKPVDLDALAMVLERAAAHRRLREEVKRLRQVVSGLVSTGGVIGQSPGLRKVFELIERIADSDVPVLITGESGTGKELAARALHDRSKRREGPYVAVNCAAMPEQLLESELFGHTRGAFTDAKTSRAGLFSQANGGTLLLDEIGEMPLGLQPKLTRALQERRVRPIGSSTEIEFEARIVTATNRDLLRAVEEGRFREDLYYRLEGIHLELPPLRARGNDVLLLAQHFLEKIGDRTGKHLTGIAPAAAERLLGYAWPGNVRELQNCVERGVALARYEVLSVEDLPEKVQNFRPSHVLTEGADVSSLVPLEEIERRYILRVVEAVGGSRILAARTLGMDRKTLYRKLEQYNVHRRPA